MKTQLNPRPIPKRTVFALFVLGIVIVGLANWDVHNRWVNLRKNGKITHGVVIDFRKMILNRNLKLDCCFYSYSVGNQRFNFKICECMYAVGDSLKIKYNPEKASEHEILK